MLCFKGQLLIKTHPEGVGGGGIYSLCNVIVTDIVPLRERGKWFGFMAGTWAIASVSGPIIGGALAEKVNCMQTLPPRSQNLPY